MKKDNEFEVNNIYPKLTNCKKNCIATFSAVQENGPQDIEI